MMVGGSCSGKHATPITEPPPDGSEVSAICNCHGRCCALAPEVISLDPWGVPVVADRALSQEAPHTFRPPSPAR